MEPIVKTMELAGREFKITNGPIVTGADGYAIVSLGDTVIMANASMSDKGREGADFFPMVVDYEENMYAAGKIKGSRFVKRAGRPSENATLISRMIDRPIRPLFPKGTTNEVQIICSVLAADLEVNPSTTAMNAASIALLMSGAPFAGPIGCVRIGYVDGELIVNPTYEQTENGKLDLVVAGTLDAITMVEAGAKEVPEDIIIKALDLAHSEIKTICQFQLDYVSNFDIEKREADVATPREDLKEIVSNVITGEMLDNVKGKTKKEINKKIKELKEKLTTHFTSDIEEGEITEKELFRELQLLLEKRMRKNILEKGERIDGRKLNEIRPISVYADVLPRVHGSAIFRRGETMALTITTLGGPGAAQILDSMDVDTEKRYIHYYHFPPYAVGDIKPQRGPGRREIGHGDLAERALLPVIPEKAEFPYTMLLVSEIVKCNGSSSMASVCGSTLSLMRAGVPIKRPVSAIAMGLVTDGEGGYSILSDIQGMEDFAGDMDFKVTGTERGITALQMDIKVKGLSMDIMRKALEQAKEGRDFIMEKMLEVVPSTRTEMSKYAPLIMTKQINPDMIRLVIGKGGETIQKITAECDCDIDIADEGLITITAPDQEKGKKALDMIEKITYVPKVGDVFDGKVVRIMDFGAFVEITPGKDGLVHISELDTKRVNKVEDVVKLGETIKVKLIKIDDQGRLSLSHKVLMGDAHGGNNGSHEGGQHSHNANHVETPNDLGGERVEGTTSVRKVNGQ